MIRWEISIFIVVGLLTVSLDYASYQFLIIAGASYNISKAFGFVIGTVFAYFANRLATFKHIQPLPGSAFRFCLVYATSLALNVSINAFILGILSSAPRVIGVAFVCATIASATTNFLGMKYFVFRSPLRWKESP